MGCYSPRGDIIDVAAETQPQNPARLRLAACSRAGGHETVTATTAGSAKPGFVTCTFTRKPRLTSRFSPHHFAPFLADSRQAED